jgi:hypothetical protein
MMPGGSMVRAALLNDVGLDIRVTNATLENENHRVSNLGCAKRSGYNNSLTLRRGDDHQFSNPRLMSISRYNRSHKALRRRFALGMIAATISFTIGSKLMFGGMQGNLCGA